MVRQGIKKIIEDSRGMEVVGEASDGLELLNDLKNITADMVIVDITMPNLRGIEATREIKMTYPETKILILTMHKKKEFLYHGLSAGAEGYLLKEETDTELLSAIETIRGGMDFITNDQRNRTTQQGIQTQNKAYGDRSWRECLLHAPGLCIHKDGTSLEVKPYRKSA